MFNVTKRLTCCAGLAAALAACATTGESGGGPDTPAPIVDPPPQDGAPLLLLAMPPSADFQDVRRSLVTEVKKNFNISTFTVAPGTTAAELGAAVARTSPACLVLMNNATVAIYREYQNAHRDEKLP